MTRNIDEINNVVENLQKSDNFIVTSHVSPDGDNIGSSMAMFYFLTKLGKKVRYVLDDDYPQNLLFLLKENKEKSTDINDSGHTVIALDSGSYERICIDKKILENASKIICIDHHITNGEYSEVKYIDTKASSTSEMVYNIISEYEKKYSVSIFDELISTYLYVGLVTDTGNFQYSNTESSSLTMAARLLGFGARKDEIIQQIFQNNSLSYYKILGEALNGLEVVDGHIAIISVTKAMMERNSISYDDIDAITPYTRDINGVELGIFIKEKSIREIKVSFRSKNYIDCSKLASEFGGGGHIRAAGCTFFDEELEAVKSKIIEKAKEYFKNGKQY